MREFKFRVWNTETKSMEDSPYSVAGKLSTLIKKTPEREPGKYTGWHASPHSYEKPLEHIIMQWTGLTDKNGVDIYENDIIYGGIKGIVLFSEGKFQGHYIDGSGGIEECWEDDLYLSINHIEVLGNIFEHENLMKEGQD